MDAWLRALVTEGLVDTATAREALVQVGAAEGQPHVDGPPVDPAAVAKLAASAPLRAEALKQALREHGVAPEVDEHLRSWLERRADHENAARDLLVEDPRGALACAWLNAVLGRLDALALPARIIAAELENGLRPEPPGAVAVVQELTGGEGGLLLGLAADGPTLTTLAAELTRETGIDPAELGPDALRESVNIAVGQTLVAVGGALGPLRPEPPRAVPLAAIACDSGTSLRTTLLLPVAPLEALVWLG